MTQETDQDGRLVLEGALTIRTIDTVHATLRQAIEPPAGDAAANLLIDCSAATEIDLAFIQLLIATRVSTRLLNRTISLAASPDSVLLDTLGRGGFRVVREAAGAFWFAGADP